MKPRRPWAGLRGRLLAAVLLSVAGALAVTVLAFNLILHARLSSDADNLLHDRASAELATLRVVDGRLHAAEAPDDSVLDSQVWVFAGTYLPRLFSRRHRIHGHVPTWQETTPSWRETTRRPLGA